MRKRKPVNTGQIQHQRSGKVKTRQTTTGGFTHYDPDRRLWVTSKTEAKLHRVLRRLELQEQVILTGGAMDHLSDDRKKAMEDLARVNNLPD